ncbi:aldo/keto reductase [Ruminococcaceae bacterium OttesenSCG-928-L11]|nr:aldo/keto reductase [Ruminococcaceae bacterium OttesenSCG-928-L11]
MQYVTLGKTGIKVSGLCLGALPMGPSQKNMSPEDGAKVVKRALELGIDFIDTAQGYRTYGHIRPAVEETGIRPVIATKSPAATYEDMDAAVKEALSALNVDVIDIFFLHAARGGMEVFEKRAEAHRCLLEYKAKGVIRAVGISTHNAKVAAAAAKREDIDVVFPIINKKGRGIQEGTREDMEQAIRDCYGAEKGVMLMKLLGGGSMADEFEEAMEYGRKLADGKAAIVLGMVSPEEVDMNVAWFEGKDLAAHKEKVKVQPKEFFMLSGMCIKCGKCMEMCHNNAIAMEETGARIIKENCLTCGYCVDACPQFIIRMV